MRLMAQNCLKRGKIPFRHLHWKICRLLHCQTGFHTLSVNIHILEVGFQMHTCQPHKCVFSNKNHQNLECSIIFRNTSANISPHPWNNSSYQILWQNHRAILHSAPPLLIPRSWECCLPIMLDYPPVQSFDNNSVNFRVHASVIFLIYGDERQLSMVYFLKLLETSPFWRWFCRWENNRLSHALPCTQNVFTNGAPIPKIYSACSFTDAMCS